MKLSAYSDNYLKERKRVLIEEIKRLEYESICFPMQTFLGRQYIASAIRTANKEIKKIDAEFEKRGIRPVLNLNLNKEGGEHCDE